LAGGGGDYTPIEKETEVREGSLNKKRRERGYGRKIIVP
jgi:hypothetical protein